MIYSVNSANTMLSRRQAGSVLSTGQTPDDGYTVSSGFIDSEATLIFGLDLSKRPCVCPGAISQCGSKGQKHVDVGLSVSFYLESGDPICRSALVFLDLLILYEPKNCSQ